MYITNVRNFLNDKGAIAPQRGSAKEVAEFHTGTIAFATDFDGSGVVAPTCFKCKKGLVDCGTSDDDVIRWRCTCCKAQGCISHWRGTLWDLSEHDQLHD